MLHKLFHHTLPSLFPLSHASACTCALWLSLFDDTHPNATFDDVLIAGHAERTVVLYVELEHPSQAPE